MGETLGNVIPGITPIFPLCETAHRRGFPPNGTIAQHGLREALHFHNVLFDA
jgi:hypothetical protein